MLLLPQNDFEYYLTIDGLETKLVFAPEGWDTDTIGSFKRDVFYRGLIRTLSLPMNFVLDGYNICKYAFDKYAYEAEVIFEVKKLKRQTFTYETIFKSELDFSQYDDDGTRIALILMEGGVSKEIKAKEDTKFEYALTGSDVVNMILPGVAFNEKGDSIFVNEGESDRFMPAIDLVVNDTNSGFVTLQNVAQEENITDESIFTSSGNWFAKGNRIAGVPINIKGVIKVDAYRPPLTDHGNDFAILLKDSTGATVSTIFQSPSLNQGQHYLYSIPFDINLTLALDRKLFIFIRTDVIPSDLKVTVTDGDLVVSYAQVSDPSNCKGIRVEDLYKRIIKRIYPQISAQSDLLKMNWNGLIITSGNGIREKSDAVIQITLKEFFNAVSSWNDAAFGVLNNIARLELATFFYRNTPIANVGNVNKCNFTVATDFIFNKLEIGYNDGNTDDTDGQFEFNSKQEWQMPVTRIQNPESKISPIRADQYGIEKIRVNYIKKTDDTSSDNSVFAVNCTFDGVNWIPILGSSYQSVTGMSSAQAGQTSYNLDLSPKQSLLRQAPYLRSMLYKLDSRYIEFASAEKNKELVTISTGGMISNPVRVAEKESVLVSNLGGNYFRPIIATISCQLNRNMMQMVDNTPFGFIEFNFNGQNYKGYIEDAGIDLAKNTEREFTLLLTPEVWVP